MRAVVVVTATAVVDDMRRPRSCRRAFGTSDRDDDGLQPRATERSAIKVMAPGLRRKFTLSILDSIINDGGSEYEEKEEAVVLEQVV